MTKKLPEEDASMTVPLAESVVAELALLEYAPSWLEWGFLDTETLTAQVARYHEGDNPHAEHYRYASFRRFLATREELSDLEIERYIALAERDPDQAMAQAALTDLISWQGLTLEQFKALNDHPSLEGIYFQRHLRRVHLMATLASSLEVPTQTFMDCVASLDTKVQRLLVEAHHLTPEQLQVLVEEGMTRAIRNLATVKLREAASRRKKNESRHEK